MKIIKKNILSTNNYRIYALCAPRFALLRFFVEVDDADEIAAYTVAYDYADVKAEDLSEMVGEIREWCGKIIECVCYAVREATYNEYWYSEEERQPLVAEFGEVNGCGHDEATTYGEQSAAEYAVVETRLQYALCDTLHILACRIGEQGDEQRAYDVA